MADNEGRYSVQMMNAPSLSHDHLASFCLALKVGAAGHR
jgi:hypothetical protein